MTEHQWPNEQDNVVADLLLLGVFVAASWIYRYFQGGL